MKMFDRVPLAWLNLTHDKRRFVIRIFGVAFAVFLMFAQMGFYNALLDAPVQLIEQFNGDIIIVSKARYALAIHEQFTTRRLEQARMVPGVIAACPVYLEYTSSWWKDAARGREKPADKPSQLIRVIAFDPGQPVLNNGAVYAHLDDLKLLDNVLFDRKSKPDLYGKIKPGDSRELADRTVHVVGTFSLGTDFTSDGSVIMSDLTYAQLFPNELAPDVTLNLADVGVLRIAKGFDEETVCRAIRETLPGDVSVCTKREFIAKEQNYWRRTTPVGFIFEFGLFLGFLVGIMICYQIISTDTAEHLPEYATLRAIGYRVLDLSLTVLREAMWLAALGFLFGWGCSYLLYIAVEELVGLPMRLNTLRILSIFGLTTLMCAASGLIALRKVRTADPAEVFA
jgi:putative ABC transport system permease protein